MSHDIRVETPRLILRALRRDDADAVHTLAGAPEIADTTLRIPHPYPRELAAQWIASHGELYRDDKELVFAITLQKDARLIGATSLLLQLEFDQAELGYWVGKPYWSHGYASEAAAGLVRLGFTTLNLNRIHAHHFARNPASGKVLRNCGMQHEGTLRQHVKKNGHYEDIDFYGILRSDWLD